MRIDLATPRKRAREVRTSKLGGRSSRRIAVVAQFPAGAPAATSTHIPHHRHATEVSRAAQLVTKHRRNRSPTFSASGQLCRAPAVSQKHVEYQAPRPVLGLAFRPRSGRARAAQPPQHRHDEEISATAAGGGGHRGAAALRQRAAPSHGSRLLDGGRKGAASRRRPGRLPARPVPVGGRPRRRDQGDGWLALGSDPLPPQPHDLRWRRRHRHWRGRECTWLCCSAGWPSLPGA